MDLFEAKIIIALQRLSCPFLDYLFYFVTLIGSEFFFIAFAAIIFWCVNKKYGYKLFFVFIMGQFVIGAIKFIVSRPRPYTLKTEKTQIKAIIERTKGGSFPSGHSQNTANISTQIALSLKNKNHKYFKRFVVIGIIITVLVMLSRVYLGQHFVSDVIVGAAFGCILAIVFSKIFELLKNKEENLFFIVFPICLIAAFICLILAKNPEEIIKVLGIFAAMSLGYYLEKRCVGYCVKSGKLFKQILKIFIGIALMFFVKEALSLFGKAANLNAKGLMLNDFIRYFVVGILASLIMPAFFKAVRL